MRPEIVERIRHGVEVLDFESESPWVGSEQPGDAPPIGRPAWRALVAAGKDGARPAPRHSAGFRLKGLTPLALKKKRHGP